MKRLQDPLGYEGPRIRRSCLGSSARSCRWRSSRRRSASASALLLRSAVLDASPGAPDAVRDAQLGAISFPQRFGSSVNPHYHYHVLALDGVISVDVERRVRFHEGLRGDADARIDERGEAVVVEEEERRPLEAVQDPRPGQSEFFEESCEAVVACGVAPTARRLAKAAGKVGLPGPGRARW